MMGKEIELRLEVPPQELPLLKGWRVLSRKGTGEPEVALDAGEIRAGRRSAPISEVELELKGGDVGDLFKLARELGKHVSVKLALTSKSQRGYDLLDNKQIEAARAEKIELRHGMSSIEAFLAIGRSILRHIAAKRTRSAKVGPRGCASDAHRPAPIARRHGAVQEVFGR